MVPLRSSSGSAKPPLGTRTLDGRSFSNEYDGLEAGELAFILGRRFGSAVTIGKQETAHTGTGFGPDRMQRLMSTPYFESQFYKNFGRLVIRLDTLMLQEANIQDIAPHVKSYISFTAAATATQVPDVAFQLRKQLSTKWPGQKSVYYDEQALVPNDTYSGGQTNESNIGTARRLGDRMQPGNDEIAAPTYNAALGVDGEAGFTCGIFTLERSAFLRGRMMEDRPVEVPDLSSTLAGMISEGSTYTAPRNLGDVLAFEALYAKLRSNSMFDWSPDGMILSKLESPSGDPLGSAAIDARQAQLFNVCVQGPSLALTWTGDPDMQCMPMDKVFILIVADAVTSSKGGLAPGPNTTSTSDVILAAKAYKNKETGSVKKLNEAMESANTFVTSMSSAGVTETQVHIDHVKEYIEAAEKVMGAQDAESLSNAQTTLEAAKEKKDEKFDSFDIDMFDERAAKVRRNGTGEVALCNFRTMRATSSFLTAYSNYKKISSPKEQKHSRCGLRLSYQETGSDEYLAVGEYIIGGWCVGTVIDNAASRSTVGHQVRIAPASMALNVNVNVEWWSGEKLFRNYHDLDGTVVRRDVLHPRDTAGTLYRNAGLDASPAHWPEKSEVNADM